MGLPNGSLAHTLEEDARCVFRWSLEVPVGGGVNLCSLKSRCVRRPLAKGVRLFYSSNVWTWFRPLAGVF